MIFLKASTPSLSLSSTKMIWFCTSIFTNPSANFDNPPVPGNGWPDVTSMKRKNSQTLGLISLNAFCNICESEEPSVAMRKEFSRLFQFLFG